MIPVDMHGTVSEFDKAIFELRSAHLYPESELFNDIHYENIPI